MLIHHDHELQLHPVILLPAFATLRNGRKVKVQHMTDEMFHETYRILKLASRRRSRLNEFSSEAEFRKEISESDCYAVLCRESGTLLASFIIGDSKFYRGSEGAADPYIIVNPDVKGQHLEEFCLRMAIEICRMKGYMGVYIDTLSTDIAIQDLLVRLGGFQKVGNLPLGGKLASGRVMDSVIYFKSFLHREIGSVNT